MENNKPPRKRLKWLYYIIVIIAGVIILLVKFLPDKKDNKQPNQSTVVTVTSNDSSQPDVTVNQPNQQNRNKGDVNNQNAKGDIVNGDKVAGDKVNKKTIINKNNDNSTNAPVTKYGDTTIIVTAPPDRHLTEEDIKQLDAIPLNFEIIVDANTPNTNEEGYNYGVEIAKHLGESGHTNAAMNVYGHGHEKQKKRFTLELDKANKRAVINVINKD